MAVHNGERFIREQLDSFIRQTRLPDDLVVSDNSPTDRTAEIVRDFAARRPVSDAVIHQRLESRGDQEFRACVNGIHCERLESLTTVDQPVNTALRHGVLRRRRVRRACPREASPVCQSS